MRVLLFSLVLLVPSWLNAQWEKLTTESLAEFMIGSFSSADQAKRDSNYANVEVEVVRIWAKDPKAVWLYLEEAEAADKGHPYRQQILRLTQVDDSVFQSTQYELDSMQLYVNAYKDPARFDKHKPEDARTIKGCVMTLLWNRGTFGGSTNGDNCMNRKSGAAYTTTEILIGLDSMLSWERGFDARGNQIWGSDLGGYEFMKR
ncbi:MAG TPA: chromophore lyase CpcT/CpeT [Flavobacteriales bacterium]|nr:chromophore lyase CpcT/CpeT [Flavobacteriales bacterium]